MKRPPRGSEGTLNWPEGVAGKHALAGEAVFKESKAMTDTERQEFADFEAFMNKQYGNFQHNDWNRTHPLSWEIWKASRASMQADLLAAIEALEIVECDMCDSMPLAKDVTLKVKRTLQRLAKWKE